MQPKRNALKPLLLALSLSLTACATTSPPSEPVNPPQIPPPPLELMEPEDLSSSYSEVVRLLLQTWRSKLTDWKTRL